jgi:hypothetical protein
MTEDHSELRETLALLHQQLEGHDLDDEARTLLRSALNEIEERLDAEGDDEVPSLSERLSEMTLQFEESHPQLAEAVGRVVDTLANLGI